MHKKKLCSCTCSNQQLVRDLEMDPSETFVLRTPFSHALLGRQLIQYHFNSLEGSPLTHEF